MLKHELRRLLSSLRSEDAKLAVRWLVKAAEADCARTSASEEGLLKVEREERKVAVEAEEGEREGRVRKGEGWVVAVVEVEVVGGVVVVVGGVVKGFGVVKSGREEGWEGPRWVVMVRRAGREMKSRMMVGWSVREGGAMKVGECVACVKSGL